MKMPSILEKKFECGYIGVTLLGGWLGVRLLVFHM